MAARLKRTMLGIISEKSVAVRLEAIRSGLGRQAGTWGDWWQKEEPVERRVIEQDSQLQKRQYQATEPSEGPKMTQGSLSDQLPPTKWPKRRIQSVIHPPVCCSADSRVRYERAGHQRAQASGGTECKGKVRHTVRRDVIGKSKSEDSLADEDLEQDLNLVDASRMASSQ